jgi:UPF0755 protein
MRIFRAVRAMAAAAILLGGFAAWRLLSPYQGFTGEVFVEIPHGSSSAGIGERLVEAGVVRGRFDFLLARMLERGRKLKAGEYKFDHAISPVEVFDRIARGDIFYYELVAPEGRNMFEIAEAVEKLGVFPGEKFLEAARETSLIRDLDPRAPTLEGYLFPDTYRLGRRTTPEQLCKLMTDRFREVWRGLNARASVHDTVTLASLVEKESKVASDRPKIAAVFANRLRIGMKLDCDPTTIYAALLEDRYRGTIYKSDLERDMPYNTYRRAGLPPGPIANPGRASLEAALSPANISALYFVLQPDGNGAHQFSDSIAAHEEATAKYRRSLHKKVH